MLLALTSPLGRRAPALRLAVRQQIRLVTQGRATPAGTAKFVSDNGVEWPVEWPKQQWATTRLGFGGPWLGTADPDRLRSLDRMVRTPCGEQSCNWFSLDGPPAAWDIKLAVRRLSHLLSSRAC